jgi:hypothetical protein
MFASGNMRPGCHSNRTLRSWKHELTSFTGFNRAAKLRFDGPIPTPKTSKISRFDINLSLSIHVQIQIILTTVKKCWATIQGNSYRQMAARVYSIYIATSVMPFMLELCFQTTSLAIHFLSQAVPSLEHRSIILGNKFESLYFYQ